MQKKQTKRTSFRGAGAQDKHKWSCILIRLIFQMLLLLLFVLCDEEGNQKQRCGLWSSTEVGPLQSRLPVEGWGISLSLSGLSQTSTAHSLLIDQSLSLLLSSTNYSRAPATAACLIWRCTAWLWCLYQHERAGDRVLIEQKGIMWLPASGGGTFFL